MGDLGLVRAADQFLFGYDDGHRLLIGSRELSPATAVALLGATDAAMTEDTAPLVTGVALPDSNEFAFAVTWSAPETPRPGAVWAHALIVGEDALRDPLTLEVLLGLPRRPPIGGSELEGYRAPVALDGVAAVTPSYLPPEPPERELLGSLAFAAYDPGGGRTVVHENLAGAAKALLALWRAQWPDLRAGFSFRTRDLVRKGASDFDLTVTRKIRGVASEATPAAPRAAQPWLRGVIADAAAAAPTPLREFLCTFGPLEPCDPRRLAALATLWLSVGARDAEAARAQLARDWPAPESGAALKQVLFGSENDSWWSVQTRA